MFLRLLVYACVILSNLKGSKGITKWFEPTWDFSNKINWLNSTEPCTGRIVKFNKKLDFPVLLDRNTAVKSIEFDKDVEIIFGRGSVIELNNNKNRSCHNQDTDFTSFEKRAGDHWWDPESWRCDRKTSKDDCNSATPDTLRVPCLVDQVRFRDVSDSSYRVILSDPVPTIKSLLIGEKNFSTSSFFDFFVSNEGSHRILKRYSPSTRSLAPLFIESEGGCGALTGCHCHGKNLTKQICRFMQNKCPEVSCTSPINMQGFCCKKCGAEIKISHNGSLSLESLKKLVKKVTKASESRGIDVFCANMNDGFHYVYFIPVDESTDFKGAVDVFKEFFSKDLNENRKHVVRFLFATGTKAEKGQTQRSVVAWVISLLIAIGVVFVAVCLYRRKRLKEIPFMFRRMSMSKMSTRSARSVSIPSVHVASFVSSTGRSFINPAFNEDPERIESFPSLPEEEGEPTEGGDSKADGDDQSDGTRQPFPWDGAVSFKDLKSVADDSKKEEISIGIEEQVMEAQDAFGDPGVTDGARENLFNIDDDFNEKDSTTVMEDADPLDLFAKSRVETSDNVNELQELEQAETENLGVTDTAQENLVNIENDF